MMSFDERLKIGRQVLGRGEKDLSLPVGLADQYQAAASDALHILGYLSVAATVTDPDRGWSAATGDATSERIATAIAAILPLQRCPHIQADAPQAGRALLGQRRLVCRRCAVRRYPSVVADDVCDLCERPTDIFRPVGVKLAWLLLLGDICPACADRFGIPSAGDLEADR